MQTHQNDDEAAEPRQQVHVLAQQHAEARRTDPERDEDRGKQA